MLNSNQISDQAKFQRERLVSEAERERIARELRASREASAMFFVYLAELLAAAGAVVILRG